MEKEIYKIDEFFNRYHLIVSTSLDFYCLQELYIDCKENFDNDGYYFMAETKGLKFVVKEFRIFTYNGEIYAEEK